MTGAGSDTVPRDLARMGCPALSTCLLAGVLAVGCNEPGDYAGWLDYFEPVDTLHVADTAFFRLLVTRDSARDGLWRVPGLGSQAWLLSPADGRRTAEALMSFPHDVGQVPYWPSWVSVLGARVEETVYGAMDLVYVVRAYGTVGSWGDSIFTDPPSWRQARRPERGEFEDATDGELHAYFSTFNVITRLAAVSEGVLIVTHGRLVRVVDDPAGRLERAIGGRRVPAVEGRAYPGWSGWSGWSATSDYVNVYVKGKRLVTDAPAPGEILGYGPGRVVFGKRGADRTGYILTEFAWQRPS